MEVVHVEKTKLTSVDDFQEEPFEMDEPVKKFCEESLRDILKAEDMVFYAFEDYYQGL